MLRYKTKTRPALVALYDIQPGNGAGPFLQPRSPHSIGQPDRGMSRKTWRDCGQGYERFVLLKLSNVIERNEGK